MSWLECWQRHLAHWYRPWGYPRGYQKCPDCRERRVWQ